MAPNGDPPGKRKLESITLSDTDDDKPTPAKPTASASNASTRKGTAPPSPDQRFSQWNNFTSSSAPSPPKPSSEEKPKPLPSSPKKPATTTSLSRKSTAASFSKPIASTSSPRPHLPFPTGTVRITREKECVTPLGTLERFKIEDLFGTGDKENALEGPIQGAVLGSGEISASNFLWRPLGCETGDLSKMLLLADTLLETEKNVRKVNHVDMKKVKKEQGGGGRGRYNLHAKFALIYRQDSCRIAIGSANSKYGSWPQQQNAMFLIDFPRLPTPSKDALSNPTHTSFFNSFCIFLTSLGVPPPRLEPFLRSLGSYDFSSSNEIQLVHSHRGKDWSSHRQQTLSFSQGPPKPERETPFTLEQGGGLTSLALAIKAFNPAPGGTWTVEAAGSSLGPLPRQFLEFLHAACSGITPREYAKNRDPDFSLDSIKVLFATEAEMAPLGGKDTTGNKPGSPAWYGGTWDSRARRNEEKDARPQVLRRNECKERRNQHTKSLVIIHHLPHPAALEAFYYLGSHNVTTAAWGKVTLLRDKVEVEISQHELGVVVRVEGGTEREIEERVDGLVGYRRPVRRYGEGDRPYEGAGGDEE